MTYLRAALPLALTFVLVACGGGDPAPTPPTDQPPVENPVPPITPVPVVPQPPENPDSGIPYYGEWIVTYTSDLGTSFIHSLNITQAAPTGGWENGGFGLQALCLDEETPCRGSADSTASGVGYIGDFEEADGVTILDLTIFTQYGPDDPGEVKVFADESLTIGTDEQGRQTLQGDAVWVLVSGSDYADGSIYAVNIGPPRTLSGLSTASDHVYEAAAEQLRRREQDNLPVR
jgi:hypothetical protein